MNGDHIIEKWEQLAIHIGDDVYKLVNTPDMVGTDDETGYVIMFFNAKNHNGKATVVSSETDRTRLKRLLKGALRELSGPKVRIVGPVKFTN